MSGCRGGTGNETYREIVLPTATAAIGSAEVYVDMVYDHMLWFEQKGAKSHRPGVGSDHAQSPITEAQSARATSLVPIGGLTVNPDIEYIRSARHDPFSPIAMSEAEFRGQCGDAPIWHSVDLGEGWIEGRRKTSSVLAQELRLANLPDLGGKTVLDIGAWGGFFSFEAARRGARVTAIDYYSWVTDFPALHEWIAAEAKEGRRGNNYEPPTHIIDPAKVPGRRPFDVVNEALGNPVTPIVTTLENFNPKQPFDVSFFLGVLYHTRDPFGAIIKLASVTSDLAIIETSAMHEPARPDSAYWHFHGGDGSVNNDPTTYWSPSVQGLQHMLRQAGFRKVEAKSQPAYADRAHLYRLWMHAWK
jgi:tRNA (mo5U34)-methyltransferase